MDNRITQVALLFVHKQNAVCNFGKKLRYQDHVEEK